MADRSNARTAGISTMLVLASALAAATPSGAATVERLTVREAKVSVQEAGDALVAALEKRGIKVVARLDHAAGAKAAGLELRPAEVIMFGNPKLGTPLMQANPEIGVELPMKILIWQDQGGKVWVGHVPPETLKERFAISGQDAVFKSMAEALSALAVAAATGGKE